MTKIIIFFLLILILAFIQVSFAFAAEGTKERSLELIYPTIPGAPTPVYVSSGLPQYIQYVYILAVIVIGFIILGVLIYNGFLWMTSAGDPGKLKNAKDGIFSGFLGAAILLFASLLFRTINPQLTYLIPADIKVVKPIIPGGIYLCNYPIGEGTISGVLNNYTNLGGNVPIEKQIQAAKDFSDIVVGQPDGPRKCFRVQIRDSLDREYVLEKGERYSLFVVPDYNPRLNPPWEYNYGVILHERDNYIGKCAIFPEPKGEKIYGQITNYSVQLDFKVRAFTPFKKIEVPKGDKEIVRMFEGLYYNDMDLLDKKKDDLADKSWAFTESQEVKEVIDLGDLHRNIRSFFIPRAIRDDYFVIFKGAGNIECIAMAKYNSNLTPYRIGHCRKGMNEVCRFFYGHVAKRALKECEPCIESVTIIQGKMLY